MTKKNKKQRKQESQKEMRQKQQKNVKKLLTKSWKCEKKIKIARKILEMSKNWKNKWFWRENWLKFVDLFFLFGCKFCKN